MGDSDSDSVNTEDLPPREECERRCQEFAQVTGTDSALAMFYLQDRDWDVQRALNAFLEERGAEAAPPQTAAQPQAAIQPSSESASDCMVTDPQPHRIRLMSWNIDGLDNTNLKTRTKGVCRTILNENPDVIYLQEVVPISQNILEQTCPAYQLIPGGQEGYYTAIMLKATSVTYTDHSVIPFYSSKMMRNLLKIEAKVKGIDMLLMTSHLESTKSHEAERKRQLKTSLQHMTDAPPCKTVVFGGDLNIRDKEVEAVKMPGNILDLWEVTGKRPEAKFTWDTTRNDNLEWNLKFRPKCRFDRLYLRHSTTKQVLKPVYFELIGLERLEDCRRFPSDHWGILAHFDKL